MVSSILQFIFQNSLAVRPEMIITKKKIIVSPFLFTVASYVLLGLIEPVVGALVVGVYLFLVLPLQIVTLMVFMYCNIDGVDTVKKQKESLLFKIFWFILRALFYLLSAWILAAFIQHLFLPRGP